MMNKIITASFKCVINLYRLFISPLSHGCCRYAPSCSEYALESLHSHGWFKGSILAIKRIIRCNPWGGSGYDPVPTSEIRSRKPEIGK